MKIKTPVTRPLQRLVRWQMWSSCPGTRFKHAFVMETWRTFEEDPCESAGGPRVELAPEQRGPEQGHSERQGRQQASSVKLFGEQVLLPPP